MALKIVLGVSGTLDACEIGNRKTTNMVPVIADFDPEKAKLARKELVEFFLDGLTVAGVRTKIGDMEGLVGGGLRRPGVEGSSAMGRG